MQYECTKDHRDETNQKPATPPLAPPGQPDSQLPTPDAEISQAPVQPVSKSDALKMVREQWPDVFLISSPKPLKVGIHNEMKQSGLLPLPVIKSALKFFTSQERYLMSIKPGRHRIGLDGKPAGKVKLKEAVNAEIMLFMRAERQRLKQQRIHVGQLRLVALGAENGEPRE